MSVGTEGIKISAETYMDIPHSLTDDELAEYEDSNPFVENYISTIDRLLGQFENLLLPEVYHVRRALHHNADKTLMKKSL